MLAWEDRGPGDGLGERGGQFIEEIAVSRRGEGIATHLVRTMRRHARVREGARVELAVHRRNTRARGLYGNLAFRISRWWERGADGWVAKGTGLYTPEAPIGYQ